MNKRITELANRAIVERSNGFREFDANVFAELIVRECVSALDEADGSVHHRECLFEHFGVEE